MGQKARSRLDTPRARRGPIPKPGPHLEMPVGLGQSVEDFHRLIESWIVPQLVRAFVAETFSEWQFESEIFEATQMLSKPDRGQET